jgi:DNA repair exonuclease SbcCD ATPase subunit
MKVRVRNFSCFVDLTVDFGDVGIVLLSGISGAGKTSLFLAILFAIFGDKRPGTLVRRASSIGKLKCEVVLTFGTWVVTRVAVPASLVLVRPDDEGGILEGPAAQSALIEKFGISFEAISLVRQNSDQTFTSRTPSGKREFLEELLFREVGVNEIRDEVKDRERLSRTESTAARARLDGFDFAEKNGTAPTSPPRHGARSPRTLSSSVSNPEDDDAVEAALVEKKRARDDLWVSLESARRDLRHASTARLKAVETEALRSRADAEVGAREGVLRDANEERDAARALCGNDVSREEARYQAVVDAGNEMKCGLQDLASEMKILTALGVSVADDFSVPPNFGEGGSNESPEPAWTGEWTSLQDAREYEADFRQQLRVAESVESLKRKRESVVSLGLDDTALTAQRFLCKSNHVDVHACPACDVFLEFSDGDLVRSSHTSRKRKSPKILDEIRCLDKAIEDARRRVGVVESIDAELDGLAYDNEEEGTKTYPDAGETRLEIARITEYISLNVKRESALAERKRADKKNRAAVAAASERMSAAGMRVQASRKIITQTYPFAATDAKRAEAVRVAETLLTTSRAATAHIEGLEKRVAHATLALDESRRRAELAHATSLAQGGDGVPSESALRVQRERVEELLQTFAELESSILFLVSERERYLAVKKRATWVREKEAARAALDDAANREFGTAVFAKHIPECQSMCMASVVDTINQHVDSLGSYLFDGEEDTCISIETSRETKTAGLKEEINLRVTRAGVDFPFKCLSGGEVARLNACFTFALNAMFSARSSVILLDELTASLDQASAEAVISRARIMFPDKLVVFISHQVVTGLFDRVVCLDDRGTTRVE